MSNNIQSNLRKFPLSASYLGSAVPGLTPSRLKNFRAQGYLLENQDWIGLQAPNRRSKEYRYAEHVEQMLLVVLKRYAEVRDYTLVFDEARTNLRLDR